MTLLIIVALLQTVFAVLSPLPGLYLGSILLIQTVSPCGTPAHPPMVQQMEDTTSPSTGDKLCQLFFRLGWDCLNSRTVPMAKS